MARLFSVKLLLTVALALGPLAGAEDPVPDARALLRSVRLAQGAKDWKLVGQLRTGRVKYPLRLEITEGSVRYEFSDTTDSITLRLSEKGSTLEESKGGRTARVTPAKFDDAVRDTDISYEDLALRFLYWNDAKVVGTGIITARSCWKVEARPSGPGESQYSRVLLWIGKEDGALMKAESYDAADKWVRRFIVRSVMKREGYWLPKQLRIESAAGRRSDSTPTYLELDDVEK